MLSLSKFALLALTIAVGTTAYEAGPCESLSGSGTPECLTSGICGNDECYPTTGSCEGGNCMDMFGAATSCETPTNKCGAVFCPGVTASGTCFCEGETCLQLELPCASTIWGNGGVCEGGGGPSPAPAPAPTTSAGVISVAGGLLSVFGGLAVSYFTL
eukprot:CAMPEP_0198298552 /NCGR_PEP_ID=MMETSP1449-20131203/41207_1 /TAXON_ID=420275 /ORGANISM="Attheya septentrionalis, Strain CCMP2084" /LENGTH=157 /DNA_ID=CAMNT_0043999843 /DNA_START=124 /DNA_END=597 /DNA_ORIENTATION=+